MKKIQLLLFMLFLSLVVLAQSIQIDGKTYTIDTLSNFKVGPGSEYTALRLKSTTRLDVFFLKVDASHPNISFKAVLGRDSIYTGEQPSAMAKRKSKEGAVYFAGTNGDFYATSGYIGYPVAGCMVESEIAKIPATDRKIIAFDENKTPTIGVMTYSGNVKFGASIWTINSVNHLRSDNRLVLFNQHNGKVTRTNAFGTEVLLQLVEGQSWGANKAIRMKVVNKEINVGNMAIPKGFAVLSGHGTAATNLNTLNVGDEIEINLNLTLDGQNGSYTEVIGGDNRNPMLKNGVVETAEVWAELHPRTAIGYSEDRKTVIYCVVDGRGASAGVTTKQLAELMKSAGAYIAFNMDGGGSSSMYVKEFNQVNTPSDGSERAVSNGIFAVSSAPTDNTISEIKSYTRKIQLPRFGVFKPKILAYNQFDVLINKDLAGVILSCAPEVGEIAADGRFIASGSRGGIVTATYNNVQTRFQVELVSSSEVSFTQDSVLMDNRADYTVLTQSVMGLNTIEVLPTALNWTVVDPSICSVQNGVLKALKSGTTWVYGSLDDFKDSIKVNVQLPTSARMLGDDFNPKNWKLEASAELNASLNTANLPTGWTHGAVVNYVFKSARAPYIRLLRNFAMYGLPDTIKVVVNVGDMNVSRAIVSLSANNTSQNKTKEFTGIIKNAETQITIPISSLFNTADIAVYPIWFNNITLYLGAQTANQAYTLAMKEIVLCYKNVQISGTPSLFASPINIYPNPVVDGLLNIKLGDNHAQQVKVEVFSMIGQQLRSQQYKNNQQEEISFSIGDLKSGTYLLKVSQNGTTESVKIVVK